jgi:hypothetical protein
VVARTPLLQVELRALTQKSERAVHTRRLSTYPAKGARVILTRRRHAVDAQAGG